MKIIVLALALSCGAFAQLHQAIINAGTPEGKLLQEIGQETDETKKLALLEQFHKEYPNSASITWIYDQLLPALVKAGKADEAIDVGAKLLAADPKDTEAALQTLKAAELKKDPALVKKWSDKTSQLARQELAEPKPSGADDEERWKKHQDYARQVDNYAEYALYALAVQTRDPKAKLDLVNTLRQRNPNSQYLTQMASQEFLAYRQAGDNAKAVAVAEKVLAKDQSNEDMLLLVADNYLQKKQNPDKVIAYSSKMIDLMNTKPKPEGVSDADWEKRKTLIIGLGHYMGGKAYFNDNKFPQADKELRAALPLISNNNDLKAETTFLLGLSNYKMKKIPDAIKFNQMCAAIRSPYQAQAQQNLKAMGSK